MKRVYVLRHAKSERSAALGNDHGRPLAARGEQDARLVGRFLIAASPEPELVISSSAVRALDTARLAAEAGGWSCDIRVEPELYEADFARVLEEIRAVDGGLDSVLVAGHEPACSAAVGSLVGSAQVRFPTAALACIELPVARWDMVEMGSGVLVWLVTPGLLAAAGLAER